MSEQVFVALSSQHMAQEIAAARSRIILAAPSLHRVVADAIAEAINHLGAEQITIALDCNEHVFRLGYGEIEALTTLKAAGCLIRQSPGIRIGILVCDDQAWSFSPVALYVEEEPHYDEAPNAIKLTVAEAQRLAMRISPKIRSGQISFSMESEEREEVAKADVEIGKESLLDMVLEQTSKALELVPPIPFDVSRQVRVFEPYIQYVDINLRGCAIERRKIRLPKTVMNIASNEEIGNRLSMTFDLVQRDSEMSAKALEDELREIRETYAKSLGKPWGRVLLRTKRPDFDKRIEKLREKMQEHQAKLRAKLKEHLNKSLTQVVEHFLTNVMASPPEALFAGIMTPKPTEEQARTWSQERDFTLLPRARRLARRHGTRMSVQGRHIRNPKRAWIR